MIPTASHRYLRRRLSPTRRGASQQRPRPRLRSQDTSPTQDSLCQRNPCRCNRLARQKKCQNGQAMALCLCFLTIG